MTSSSNGEISTTRRSRPRALCAQVGQQRRAHLARQPRPVCIDQLCDGARRLHARRPRFVQREAQRRQRRGRRGRRGQQPELELRRGGSEPRRQRAAPAAAPDTQPHGRTAAVARRADAAYGRRVRAHKGVGEQVWGSGHAHLGCVVSRNELHKDYVALCANGAHG
eukprot:364007-Chlamydomonas_euryale.AAC.5